MTRTRRDKPADDFRAAGQPGRRTFEREVERLMDRLYGTALRLTRDPHDAEDVVAEAVGKAWARLDQLRDGQSLEGWLFQILNNTFISAWRRRRCRQDRETPLDAGEDREEDGFSLYGKLHQPFLLWWGGPEQQYLDDLLLADIQAAIDDLPDSFRLVVVLIEVEGHTYEEAADLLRVPLGTVRSRLSRGRSLLQKKLWDQARDAGLGKTAPECRARKEAEHD
jgi:RNA polymerase sigma-70 factor (ECF subfamily)